MRAHMILGKSTERLHDCLVVVIGGLVQEGPVPGVQMGGHSWISLEEIHIF